MTEMTTDFRTLGPGDAIPDDYVVPFYLDDRKIRVSVARVGGRLYAFDDLCTHEACPLSAGLLTGTTIMCQCHGSRFDITTGAILGAESRVTLEFRAAAPAPAVQPGSGSAHVRRDGQWCLILQLGPTVVLTRRVRDGVVSGERP